MEIELKNKLEVVKVIFDIEEEITMKTMRVLFPIYKKYSDGDIDEITLTYSIATGLLKDFGGNENKDDFQDFIDGLSIEEFKKLSDFITKILSSIEDKKKETSES